MEFILILLAVAIAAGLIWRLNKKPSKDDKVPELTQVVEPPAALVEVNTTSVLDQNGDGQVNVQDVKAVVKKAQRKVKAVVDVNKDGAVNTKDVAAVVEKIKPRSKKTSKKA
jgi:biopolymer transport protein ExbD